jgi:hypothetical protein
MNDNFVKLNKFTLECCNIFGSIILAHIRQKNISVAELSNNLLMYGKNYNYRSLYIGLTGNNVYIKDFRYFQRIFEVLNIEINAQTFAQTLQDSQQFNANFKALKQAKKDAKKTN